MEGLSAEQRTVGAEQAGLRLSDRVNGGTLPGHGRIADDALHGLDIAVFAARPRADQYAVGTKPVFGEVALAVRADFVRAEIAGLAVAGKLQALTFNAGGKSHGGAPVA